MSSTERREHRQVCTRSTETRNTWSTGNIRSTEPRNTESPRSAYIYQNTARCLSTRVIHIESNLLQLPLVGLSGSVLCRTMGLKIVDTVHRRSQYASYSKCTGHVEGISVQYTVSTRRGRTNTTNGRNTARLVPAVPAVQNPDMLEAQQGVSTNSSSSS